MRGTNSVDLSGLHMLESLADELYTFTGADGKCNEINIFFGNIKYEVNEIFLNASLIKHMYGKKEPGVTHGDRCFRTMEEAIRRAMANKPDTPDLKASPQSVEVRWSDNGASPRSEKVDEENPPDFKLNQPEIRLKLADSTDFPVDVITSDISATEVELREVTPSSRNPPNDAMVVSSTELGLHR